ncbi:MAG: trigger factor [Patescibacteria group bacterium]
MFSLKNLPDSKVEIDVEIPADEFNLFFQQALLNAQRDLVLPGFRKGMVPEKKVIEHLGHEHVLLEAAELAISTRWPKIIQEADIEPVGKPEISITKIASGNPLGFKITSLVLQKFTLPDYKTIVKNIVKKPLNIEVADEEVDKALEYVEKNNPFFAKALADKSEGAVNPAADKEKLKDAIRQNFKFEKERKAKDNRRIEMLEAIAKEIKIELPSVVIDSEVEKMINELRASVAQMGLDWNEYISHVKKSEDDLKKEWRGQAEMRIKVGIIMREIARAEKLSPPKKDVDKKVEEILRGLTEDERAKSSPESIADYVIGRYLHEMVFDLLEKV